jgi:N-acetylmuramoyl-L-alanine amidase
MPAEGKGSSTLTRQLTPKAIGGKFMNIRKKVTAFFTGVLLTALILGNSAFAASYTVASNDSLYKIGNMFGTSAETIKSNNNLTGNVIHPGQVLYVNAVTYTVKSGDTLYLIAKRYGISLNSLRAANHKWNDMLYMGQKLTIPVKPGTLANQATPAPSVAASGSAVISYTQSDLDLLARLITAEADGEPYSAMVGVGAVVISRVESSQFPNTLSSVIYEKSDGYYQFTPVENGFINKPATDAAKKAAYDALHGSDPSAGALYYFDDSATNKWLWSKPLKARIGHMVFVL